LLSFSHHNHSILKNTNSTNALFPPFFFLFLPSQISLFFDIIIKSSQGKGGFEEEEEQNPKEIKLVFCYLNHQNELPKRFYYEKT